MTLNKFWQFLALIIFFSFDWAKVDTASAGTASHPINIVDIFVNPRSLIRVFILVSAWVEVLERCFPGLIRPSNGARRP